MNQCHLKSAFFILIASEICYEQPVKKYGLHISAGLANLL